MAAKTAKRSCAAAVAPKPKSTVAFAPRPPATGGKGDIFFGLGNGMDPEDGEEGSKEPAGSLAIDDAYDFGVLLEFGTTVEPPEGHPSSSSLGSLRARFKWFLATIVGRRGIDCRQLLWQDLEVDQTASAPKDAARMQVQDPDAPEALHCPFRIRIGNSKNVERSPDMVGPVRGELTWLPIMPTARGLAFLRRAVRELRFKRGARPTDRMFPFKETDATAGYEAFRKRVVAARKVFEPKNPLSCPARCVTTHTPRRTFATVQYRLNTCPYVICKFTGHEDPESLRWYVCQGGVYMRECAMKLGL